MTSLQRLATSFGGLLRAVLPLLLIAVSVVHSNVVAAQDCPKLQSGSTTAINQAALDAWLDCLNTAKDRVARRALWQRFGAQALAADADGTLRTGAHLSTVAEPGALREQTRWLAADGELAVQWLALNPVGARAEPLDVVLVWLTEDRTRQPRIAYVVAAARANVTQKKQSTALVFSPIEGLGASVVSRADRFNAIGIAETQVAGLCGSSGMLSVFRLLADAEIAVKHPTRAVIRGRSSVNATDDFALERWQYAVYGSGVSTNGLLAFSFGRYIKANVASKSQDDAGFFVRVWVADSSSTDRSLRLALDFAN